MERELIELLKIEVVARAGTLQKLKEKLNEIGVTSFSVYDVKGFGSESSEEEVYRGFIRKKAPIPRIKVEMVISTIPKKVVVDALTEVLRTGEKGDGKIFIFPIQEVIQIRTGKINQYALNSEDDENVEKLN